MKHTYYSYEEVYFNNAHHCNDRNDKLRVR